MKVENGREGKEKEVYIYLFCSLFVGKGNAIFFFKYIYIYTYILAKIILCCHFYRAIKKKKSKKCISSLAH